MLTNIDHESNASKISFLFVLTNTDTCTRKECITHELIVHLQTLLLKTNASSRTNKMIATCCHGLFGFKTVLTSNAPVGMENFY